MSINVKTRKFLSEDMDSNTVVSTSFSTEDYPEANVTISDGFSSLYFSIFFSDKQDMKKDIKALRTLAEEITNLCDLVEENKSAALKAAIRE